MLGLAQEGSLLVLGSNCRITWSTHGSNNLANVKKTIASIPEKNQIWGIHTRVSDRDNCKSVDWSSC